MEKEKLENEFRAFLRKIKTPAIDRGFDQTVFDWFYKQLDEKDKEIDGCYYAYESFKLEIKSLEDKIKELQPVSPSEDKTAEEIMYGLLAKYDSRADKLFFAEHDIYKAMTEYATLCRNKAIEEAVQLVKEKGNGRPYLISELNKLKA